VIPIPLRRAVNGLLVRLFVMVSVPVRVPVAVGVKVTLMLQLAPTNTLPMQLSVSAKSEGFVPINARLEIIKVELPLLLRAIVCAGVVVPTGVPFG